MAAPWFRFLTQEELKKLSVEEHIAYTEEVIRHAQRTTRDRQKAIDPRNERLDQPKADQ